MTPTDHHDNEPTDESFAEAVEAANSPTAKLLAAKDAGILELQRAYNELGDKLRECGRAEITGELVQAGTMKLEGEPYFTGLLIAMTVEELQQLEGAMRLMPAPDADKAVSINAIHALLETSSPND